MALFQLSFHSVLAQIQPTSRKAETEKELAKSIFDFQRNRSHPSVYKSVHYQQKKRIKVDVRYYSSPSARFMNSWPYFVCVSKGFFSATIKSLFTFQMTFYAIAADLNLN